jgi:putative peptidoglycan lipid II flippase
MKKNFIKTLSTVFILTAVAKVLGLIRDIVFAQYYGTGMEATAYFAAIKIPTQIVDIVLGSSIVSTFIPVFNEIMQKDGKDNANKFANKFISVVAMIATLISVIGVIFAPYVVSALAGGFDDATHMLTVELIRITFPMIIFTALAYSFVGFLQSYGEFNIPAAMSAVSNMFVIVFLLLFNSKTGIHGVTYAIVIAWALQFIIQIPFAKKFGYDFSFNIEFKDKNLHKVFKLAIPILISTAVIPINSLVSMSFASGMQEGSVSALEYAYKLYIVIYGVFSYAIGNIIFPKLSRENVESNSENFKQTIVSSIKLLALVLIPLSIGIMIYRGDIIRIIYERGEFNELSTALTSNALFYYAIGIFGAGIVEVMNKAFYARQDTKTPLVVGISMIIANLVLCYVLGNSGLSYAGLALSTALCTIINALTLLIILNKKIGGIISIDTLIHFVKIILSTVVMAIVVIALDSVLVSSYIFVRLLVGVGAGFATYAVLSFLLKTISPDLIKKSV